MKKICTLALIVSGAAIAGSDYAIDHYVIGAGGGVSVGGGYELRSAIGQPLAHAPVTAGPYTLTGGFLAIPRASSTPVCPGDTNGDNEVNFTDLNAVLSVFGQTGTPGFTGADLNNDGAVDFSDLNAVLSTFGSVCG